VFITQDLPSWYLYFRDHFRQRLKERYGLKMKRKEYPKLNAALKKQTPFIVSDDGSTSMYVYKYKNKFLYILFDEWRGIAKTCFLQTNESWNVLVNKRKIKPEHARYYKVSSMTPSPENPVS